MLALQLLLVTAQSLLKEHAPPGRDFSQSPPVQMLEQQSAFFEQKNVAFEQHAPLRQSGPADAQHWLADVQVKPTGVQHALDAPAVSQLRPPQH